MYIALFLSILTLLPIVHSIVNIYIFSPLITTIIIKRSFNLDLGQLHPPPRSVALIRQCLPLLPFPSQFNISCLLHIAVEKLILTNLVACKIEMKICTFHVDCHKRRHILDKNY